MLLIKKALGTLKTNPAYPKIKPGKATMNEPALDRILLLTLVRAAVERSRARMLIDSIRSFGGGLSDCPIWLFETDPQTAPDHGLEDLDVQVFSLSVPDTVRQYCFADKVYACARAEELAPPDVQSLIWIDPACLVINPPLLFDLGPSFDAAVRPVHIRNVGLPPAEPLNGFWKKIYETVGVQDIQTSVETFVDVQRIRAYFNSHAFAVRPSKGLLRRWFECFEALVCDEDYQKGACQDEGHHIFLHQAVSSALLAASLDPERVRVLPPDYNYPYNLHPSVPVDRRAAALNDLVCIAYEDRSLYPGLVDDIDIRDPLRSWLSSRAEHDNPSPQVR